MSSSVARTVVLVHGAWSAGWVWDDVRRGLAELDVDSIAPDLPGRGESELPLGDLYEDAAFLSRLLKTVDGDVVLVGHSYSGAVMSEAAIDVPAVSHLVYLAGFCLEVGEAFMPLRLAITDDRTMAAATYRSEDRSVALVDTEAARDLLFGSASDEIAEQAAKRLGPQLISSFWQPVTAAPWREVPSTYVRCARDRALPLEVQDVMAARCRAVVTLDVDHSPHVSHPVAVVDVIAAVSNEAPFDPGESSR